LLHKQNIHMITEDKPYHYDNDSGYGSHIEPLLFIFEHIPKCKKAVELGMGYFSTPLLLEKCESVVSVEMQEESWFNDTKTKLYNDRWTPVLDLLEDAYLRVDLENVSFGLSDGHGSTRPEAINHFMQNNVETIVAHDTESTWYGWERVSDTAEFGYYSYTFNKIAPYTTVWTKNQKLIDGLKALDGKGSILVLNQPRGIGDLIFCQTLAHHFKHHNYKVVFNTDLLYVEDLNRAYSNMSFMSNIIPDNNREEFKLYEKTVYPLRFSDSICKTPYKNCMKSKYWMYNLVWQNWKRNASWKRDIDKESKLFNLLGLKPDSEYTLVNNFFTTGLNRKVNIETSGNIVEMRFIQGYSLFDWAMVIQKATKIHTVSTAIIYLLELLDIGQIPVFIYKREPIEKDHSNYDYILTKPNYILL